MSQFTPAELETARNQELAHITSRNMQVTICALGSTLFSYMIGSYLASMLFGPSMLMRLIFSTLFVYLAFLAIDWAFLNRLVGASSVGSETASKRLLRSAYVFLVATLLMSIVSVFFVGNEIKGESHLKTENQLLVDAEKRDSTLKMEMIALAKQAEQNRPRAIREAKARGHALVVEAIAKGSRSWQQDFRKAGNDMSHWFYTCRRGKHCPQDYIDYRNGILQARKDSTTLVAQASGAASSYQDALMRLSGDTTHMTTQQRITANTMALEAERNWKGHLITLGLAVLSIFCGILAVQETRSLIELRREYGQQVSEDNVTSILKIKDLIARIPDTLLDLLYNILIRWWDQAKDNGKIVAYTANATTFNQAPANNQQFRQQQRPTAPSNSAPTADNSSAANSAENGWSSVPHTTNNQQAKPTAAPTGETNSATAAANSSTNSKKCSTGKCAPKPAAKTANSNPKLKAGAEDMVKIRERCRTAYKRYHNYLEKGKHDAATRNEMTAHECAAWLRKHGATVDFDAKGKNVSIHLPTV